MGQRAGNYILGEQIGEGIMGGVFEATHPVLAGRHAVKILHDHMAREDNSIQRIKRVAEVSRRLTHPNIIEIRDFGPTGAGSYYIAMEYIDGQDLASYFAGHGRLPPDQVIDLLRQTCQALAHAHKQGVIHRDLKPGNIMLTGDQPGGRHRVKVLDFDMAKYLDESEDVAGGGNEFQGPAWHDLTLDWEFIGTPEYMSPEQGDRRPVDGRSDLYSLGCIAYEAMTGAPPFTGEPWAVLIAHKERPVAPPSSLGVILPAGIEALILECLEKQPGMRPASAEEVARRLAEMAP